MQRVGFVCDVRETSEPEKIVGYARRQRAVPMAHALREHGIEVLAYSRHHVNPDTGTVFGYLIEADGYRPCVAPVPRFNGNWFLGTYKCRNRSGLNRRRFAEWIQDHGRALYPPQEFLTLTLDKHESFLTAADFDPGLCPFSELYTGDARQLAAFFERGPVVFLKPRYGSQGEHVIVARRDGAAGTVTSYAGSKRTTDDWTTVETLRDRVAPVIDGRAYVIQDGVNVKRYDDGAWIVRVIMLHDGSDWHWTHKIVVSTGAGDVANTTQGGLNYTLDDALPRIFGPDGAARVTAALKRLSFDFSAYLHRSYPGQLAEVAYDFLVDEDERPWLAEFDVQPGVMKPGMNLDCPFRDMFNIAPDEQDVYDRYVVPHARCLAGFFRSKLESAA